MQVRLAHLWVHPLFFFCSTSYFPICGQTYILYFVSFFTFPIISWCYLLCWGWSLIITLLYPSLCWGDAETDQHKEPMIDTKIIVMDSYLALDFLDFLNRGKTVSWQGIAVFPVKHCQESKSIENDSHGDYFRMSREIKKWALEKHQC